MSVNLFGGFGILLIVLVVSALWSTLKMVTQGYNYTVETFGAYTLTLHRDRRYSFP
jgi:regulator of protease activity HflC (stomatin/prohibitin superfamily)